MCLKTQELLCFSIFHNVKLRTLGFVGSGFWLRKHSLWVGSGQNENSKRIMGVFLGDVTTHLFREAFIWVVVKIMVPFCVPIVMRLRIFRVPKKGP